MRPAVFLRTWEGQGDWAEQAACRGTDPNVMFVAGQAEQAQAKRVCIGCPVQTECLADALDNRIAFGVWGGMTERERRSLLRSRPKVRSWRSFLVEVRTASLRLIDVAPGEPTGAVLRLPAQPAGPAGSGLAR